MRLAAAACATVVLILVGVVAVCSAQQANQLPRVGLPPPRVNGGMPLTEAIATRRSIRQFAPTPLEMPQLAQLCWAAQGITDPQSGKRTAPSAGALYPIELYLVTAAGIQHYLPQAHALESHLSGDLRSDLSRAALAQQSITSAPACFVITAAAERTAVKYGNRAERYCFIEAGHIAQNLLLQATALGLAGVPAGAFDDAAVAKVLNLPEGVRPLYLVCVGLPPK